jgi:FAD synthetase
MHFTVKMIRVMATGVFDIVHLGHLHYLQESKSFGDYLMVVVASDYTAAKHGKRLIFNENERLELIRALKPVDYAVVGHSSDNIFKTVEELKPDIITLGYDQNFDENYIVNECKKLGLNVTVKRTSKYDGINNSSSIIRKKILETL